MYTLKEKIVWHDILSPTKEDIEFIKRTVNPHPVILEELKTPSGRQKAEIYDGYLYLILHFPVYHEAKRTSLPVEIDILANKNEIITVHYEELEPLTAMQERCAALSDFKNYCLGETTADFIYRLVENIIEFAQRQLRHIDEKVSLMEEAIFGGKEKEMIREISVIKRDILDFRRILRPLHGTLESLEKRGADFFGSESKIYFSDLVGDYTRLWNLAENYKDTIESLEATNQALLSSKIDEVMRIIAVLAFLLAPFTVIGGLFQINTQFTPIIGNPSDWWIITALMFGGCVLLYFYFKRRGWL